MTKYRNLLVLILLFSGLSLAQADVIHLTTGGVVRGRIVKETNYEVIVRTRAGFKTTIFHEDIVRIERSGGDDVPETDAPTPAPEEEADEAAPKETTSPTPGSKAALLPDDLQDRTADCFAPRPETRRAAYESLETLLADSDDDTKSAVFEVLTREAGSFRRRLNRLTGKVDRLFSPRNLDRCVRAFDTWSEARDEALRVIFDKSIYPDENHGAAGQEIVDEKVDRVRAIWKAFDRIVERDLRGASRLSEDRAGDVHEEFTRGRAIWSELVAFCEAHDRAVPTAPEKVGPTARALLAHRAGAFGEARSLVKEKVTPYERYLIRRLTDRRVIRHNDRVARTRPKTGKRPTKEEREQVRITNAYRMMMGRRALEIDPRLVASARGHSQEMTRLGYFDHSSPIPERRSPSKRARLAGYKWGCTENISYGSPGPRDTHQAWYTSSGHHRNMLNAGHEAMGSGKDGSHWTQNYGSHGTLKR